MLSPKGNPSMDNLAAIFGAIGSRLKVDSKFIRFARPNARKSRASAH